MDIVGASLGIFLMIPLGLLIAAAVKIETKGPVIQKLERVSCGRPIWVYKFRSMVKDAHEKRSKLMHLNERSDGPFFKMTHDPRVTKVGRLIRKFRVDELPQFVNVLKGELALVGPRPHETGEVASYPEKYKNLPLARAGVTGLSQVNGASSLSWLKELEYDEYYVEHVSLWLDLKIIFKSIAILFFDPTAV